MLDMKDVSVWIKGLLNAGISGGTVAISTMVIAPETFNFGSGLSKLMSAAGVSAIVSIAKYLSTNPMPVDRPELEIQKGGVSIKYKGQDEGNTSKETLKDMSETAVTAINKITPEIKQ